jgi:ectoine hydroxylase-related dioxygenase (phytanoyl-CoA dioxygenase family)
MSTRTAAGAQTADRCAAQVDDVVAALDRDGYAVVDALWEAAARRRAHDELNALLAATPFGRDDFEGRRTRRVYGLFAKTRALDAIAIDPLVVGVLDRVLGPSLMNAPAAIEIGAGERAQPLHRDDAIYPLGSRRGEVVFSVMWPLVDFTERNGGTCVVPRSHRAPRDAARPAPEDAVGLEIPAGSAVFYVGSLWHGGGANRADAPRLGVVLNYVAGWLRPIESHALGVPRAVVATLPERLREMLGYGLHPPFIGYVDGRHPRHLLGGEDAS